MKKLFVNGRPHLCLFAVSDIQPGEQILYDYGDDAGHLFWRDKVCIVYCIDFYSSSTLFCIGHKSITVRRLFFLPATIFHSLWRCIFRRNFSIYGNVLSLRFDFCFQWLLCNVCASACPLIESLVVVCYRIASAPRCTAAQVHLRDIHCFSRQLDVHKDSTQKPPVPVTFDYPSSIVMP